jgi:proteasome activator subunit 4
MFIFRNLESSTFIGFIRYARVYFDVNSTREMLDEWRRMLCPFDTSMSVAFERFKLFLPVVMYEHESVHGYKLWLTEILALWSSFTSKHFWDSVFFENFFFLNKNKISYKKCL